MRADLDDLKIAIVHEWLAAKAGSEFVFEQLAAAFPTADLYALTVEPEISFDTGNRWIRTTLLQQHRVLRDRREWTLPLMPLAWRAIDRGGPYDLVISSAHAFAREFPIGEARHISYVHAPMRYAWTPELDPRIGSDAFPQRMARRGLRWADKRRVESVDLFLANSSAVADRLERFYGRTASVLHPPVRIDDLLTVVPRRTGYALALSRWISYKRMDLAIEACADAGIPLMVAGSGPEEQRLRDLARRCGGETAFVTRPSRQRVVELMADASVFIFPSHEDFGIVAVEAQAAGLPVVALAAGGAIDTVGDGSTGVLVEHQTRHDFARGIEKCLAMDLSAAACQANARRFSCARFQRGVREAASSVLAGRG